MQNLMFFLPGIHNNDSAGNKFHLQKMIFVETMPLHYQHTQRTELLNV
jgi:hypothetical protein